MIQFRVLSFDDAEHIRQWRNEDLSNLRTTYLLTELMQEEWYRKVVSNRDSGARWWSVWGARLVGCVGLEHIEWENRRAEVSLVVDPACRGNGHGRAAVSEILRRAWEDLNLDSVWGEVYDCGPVGFWREVLPPGTEWATLPRTKWWGGRYYGSQVFTVLRGWAVP